MLNPLLIPGPSDDPGYIDAIARLIGGAAGSEQINDVRVFKIDNWFDHKWLQFSGNIAYNVGVWQKRTTVPPFVPNRVVWQGHYLKGEHQGELGLSGPGESIHVLGRSAANLSRRIADIVPSSGLFWFSGNSGPDGRGCLMGYLPTAEQKLWCWYVGLERRDGWKIARRHGIQPYELRRFDAHPDTVSIA